MPDSPKLHDFLENFNIVRKKGVLWSRNNQKIKLAPVSSPLQTPLLKTLTGIIFWWFFSSVHYASSSTPVSHHIHLVIHLALLFIPFSPTLSIFTGFIAASSDLTCFRSHNSTHACSLSLFPDSSQSMSLPLFLPYFSVPAHVVPKWRPFLVFLRYSWLSNFQLKNRVAGGGSNKIISRTFWTPPPPVTKDVIATLSVPQLCKQECHLLVYLLFWPLSSYCIQAVNLARSLRCSISFPIHLSYRISHSACLYFWASLIQHALFCLCPILYWKDPFS